MGVTYKLKQEITDFIIEKKRSDPSLSCRKLVLILNETFKIKVSKSSINAIIKDSRLSGPVGRLPRQGADTRSRASKNFLIPSEKKEQLLACVAPFLENFPKVAEAKEMVEQESFEDGQCPLQGDVEDMSDNIIEALSLPADVLTQKVEPVGEGFSQPPHRSWIWEGDRGVLLGKAGILFVRAVMQDMMRRPSLGYAMARAAGMDLAEAESLEAAIFARAMSEEVAEGLEKSEPLRSWRIFNMEPQRTEAVIAEFLGKNIRVCSLAMAFESELAAAGVCAGTLRCVADTGETFILSADLDVLASGAQEWGGRFALKAIEFAVDSLVGVEKQLIFCQEEVPDKNFHDFLMFLAGRSTYMLDKIELWSKDLCLIWSYVVNKAKDVGFVVSIECLVGQSEIDKNQPKECYIDYYLGERYLLSEGICKLDQLVLRAIEVECYDSAEKTILLTNIPLVKASQHEILEKYLKRMSKIRKTQGQNNLCLRACAGSTKFDIKAIAHVDALLIRTFDLLKNKTREFFFSADESDMIMDEIIGISGYIKYAQASVHVRLAPEKGFSRIAALNRAIDVANRSCITDYSDRKYHFSISMSDNK